MASLRVLHSIGLCAQPTGTLVPGYDRRRVRVQGYIINRSGRAAIRGPGQVCLKKLDGSDWPGAPVYRDLARVISRETGGTCNSPQIVMTGLVSRTINHARRVCTNRYRSRDNGCRQGIDDDPVYLFISRARQGSLENRCNAVVNELGNSGIV